MKLEGAFQYMTPHRIVFNVSQITLTDSERGVTACVASQMREQITSVSAGRRSERVPAQGLTHLLTSPEDGALIQGVSAHACNVFR